MHGTGSGPHTPDGKMNGAGSGRPKRDGKMNGSGNNWLKRDGINERNGSNLKKLPSMAASLPLGTTGTGLNSPKAGKIALGWSSQEWLVTP